MRTSNLPLLWLFCVIAPSLVGCGDRGGKNSASPGARGAAPTLIATPDRAFHHGRVLGTVGRRLEHRYHLANQSGEIVRVARVENRKPCCGTVEIDAPEIAPGGEADVLVTLDVGGRFGEVVHEAALRLEGAGEEEIILRTAADVLAPLRVEAEPPVSGTGSGGELRFRAIAQGLEGEPAADLARLRLESGRPAEWAGAPVVEEGARGLVVARRSFVVRTGEDSGEPGPRRTSVRLFDGDTLVLDHPVQWTVRRPIEAMPKMLVLQPGRAEYRLVLTATDRRPFRVLGCDTAVAGLAATAGEGPAAMVAVMVKDEASAGGGRARGVLTVRTDHPAQPSVEIAVVSLNP